MKTVDKPDVLDSLRSRLEALSPTAEAQWGKMSVQQMLVHCALGMERVTRGELFPDMPGKPTKFIKFLALWTPMPWPKNLPTDQDPASDPVEEGGFDADRTRAITALEAMAQGDGSGFAPSHPAFGAMTVKDWRRWAQRHLDHHLRQFGA